MATPHPTAEIKVGDLTIGSYHPVATRAIRDGCGNLNIPVFICSLLSNVWGHLQPAVRAHLEFAAYPESRFSGKTIAFWLQEYFRSTNIIWRHGFLPLRDDILFFYIDPKGIVRFFPSANSIVEFFLNADRVHHALLACLPGQQPQGATDIPMHIFDQPTVPGEVQHCTGIASTTVQIPDTSELIWDVQSDYMANAVQALAAWRGPLPVGSHQVYGWAPGAPGLAQVMEDPEGAVAVPTSTLTLQASTDLVSGAIAGTALRQQDNAKGKGKRGILDDGSSSSSSSMGPPRIPNILRNYRLDESAKAAIERGGGSAEKRPKTEGE